MLIYSDKTSRFDLSDRKYFLQAAFESLEEFNRIVPCAGLRVFIEDDRQIQNIAQNKDTR